MITKKKILVLTLTLLIGGSLIASFLINSQNTEMAIDRNTSSKSVYYV